MTRLQFLAVGVTAALVSLSSAQDPSARPARWLDELASDDAKVRAKAVDEIYRLGVGPDPEGRAELAVLFKRAYRIARADNPAVLPPELLARCPDLPEKNLRNYAAQIALRYLESGGSLSARTLARFGSDPQRQIRGYQIGDKGWPEFLLLRVQGTPVSTGDVAAIASMTLHAEPEVRLAGYHALTLGEPAPVFRDAALAKGLVDENERIRASCAHAILQLRKLAPLRFDDDVSVVPALRRALGDHNPKVQEAAERALEARDAQRPARASQSE